MDWLETIPAKDVADDFDRFCDAAVARPIAIKGDGDTHLVMLSFEEYERLRALPDADRRD